MLSKKEKVDVLVERIKEVYFSKNRVFKEGLKDLLKEGIIKKGRGYEYSYGVEEEYEYFVLIDEKKEGYIWIKTNIFENGGYIHKDIVIATEEYKDIEWVISRYLNINELRKEFVEMLREMNRGKIEYKREKVFSYVYFDSRIRKPIRMKVLGLLVYLLRGEMTGEWNKEIEEEEKGDYLIWRNKGMDYEEIDVNRIIGRIVLKNIEYILKEEIDINSIERYMNENVM